MNLIFLSFDQLFNIPLWLNADILPGPGSTSPSSNPKPVDPQMFLKLCVKYFPTKVQSTLHINEVKALVTFICYNISNRKDCECRVDD